MCLGETCSSREPSARHALAALREGSVVPILADGCRGSPARTARRERREGERHERQSKKLTHRVHVHLLSRCRPRRITRNDRVFPISKSGTQKKTPLVASGVGSADSGRVYDCVHCFWKSVRGR